MHWKSGAWQTQCPYSVLDQFWLSFFFFFLFCESWERWHSLSVFPLCWIALRWITNKRPRNTVKISFHCLCSDFPFIAKIQHPFPALNVMHTIALLSVWKPNLTGGGGIKDQITSSVCKTVQSEASVFSRAIQNRLIRQDYILRLHCLPASSVIFFTIFEPSLYVQALKVIMALTWPKKGSIWRKVCRLETCLHIAEQWMDEHKGILLLFVFMQLRANSISDVKFKQNKRWLYPTIASGRHQMRIVQEKRKQSQRTPSARQHWKTSSKSVTETGVGPKSNSESPPLQFDLHCIVCKLIQKLYKFLDTEVNNLWEYFSSFIW